MAKCNKGIYGNATQLVVPNSSVMSGLWHITSLHYIPSVTMNVQVRVLFFLSSRKHFPNLRAIVC